MNKELELAREAFRLIAEGKMPSREEIERAAKKAASEALAERKRQNRKQDRPT